MKTLKILKYTFTVIGVAMLFGAFASYNSTSAFIDRATETSGIVTELVYSRSSDSTSYYPVVAFQDASGREIVFQSRAGSNPPSFRRGERISVLYEPSAPENAQINSFFSLWGMSLIVGGLGLV